MFLVILRCAMDDLPIKLVRHLHEAQEVMRIVAENPQKFADEHAFEVDASIFFNVGVWQIDPITGDLEKDVDSIQLETEDC